VRRHGIRKFVRCCAKICTLVRIATVTSNMTCRREQKSIGSCVQAITARFLSDSPNPCTIGPRNDMSNGKGCDGPRAPKRADHDAVPQPCYPGHGKTVSLILHTSRMIGWFFLPDNVSNNPCCRRVNTANIWKERDSGSWDC
jgi:hypothetical protein